MLHEYAIDPTGLRRRGPMWMLLEQFGVSKGRLVAGFPKYWSRMVYDAVRATDCPDIEKAWILERLRKHKSSLGNLSGPRDYSGVSWIDSAVESNIQNPFRAIISEETVPNVENYLNPLDATDDHPLWKVGRPPIPRKARDIAACAGPLGKISKQLLFVDPHIKPYRPWLNVIREVLDASGIRERQFKRIELHVSTKSGNLTRLAQEIREKVFEGFPTGTSLRILQWDTKSVGDVMHARYFLTERGGIRFDYGLTEGNLGETTDVQLLDEAIYQARWDNYQQESAAFKLVCEPVWSVA